MKKRVKARRKINNEAKSVYYRQWLEGYSDPHAENNLHTAKNEYADRKSRGRLSSVMHSSYKGYIAGLKARLSDKRRK